MSEYQSTDNELIYRQDEKMKCRMWHSDRLRVGDDWISDEFAFNFSVAPTSSRSSLIAHVWFCETSDGERLPLPTSESRIFNKSEKSFRKKFNFSIKIFGLKSLQATNISWIIKIFIHRGLKSNPEREQKPKFFPGKLINNWRAPIANWTLNLFRNKFG